MGLLSTCSVGDDSSGSDDESTLNDARGNAIAGDGEASDRQGINLLNDLADGKSDYYDGSHDGNQVEDSQLVEAEDGAEVETLESESEEQMDSRAAKRATDMLQAPLAHEFEFRRYWMPFLWSCFDEAFARLGTPLRALRMISGYSGTRMEVEHVQDCIL